LGPSGSAQEEHYPVNRGGGQGEDENHADNREKPAARRSTAYGGGLGDVSQDNFGLGRTGGIARGNGFTARSGSGQRGGCFGGFRRQGAFRLTGRSRVLFLRG
jgi:hypothetical protein